MKMITRRFIRGISNFLCYFMCNPREIQRQLAEILWAERLRSLTERRKETWLSSLSISPGNWAVGYQWFYIATQTLLALKPKHILDIGLGQSSKLFAKYVESMPDAKHLVVEHNPAWIDFFKNDFIPSDKTSFCCLDLVEGVVDGLKCPHTYLDFHVTMKNRKFDLISIDAPFGVRERGGGGARVDILSILPDCLSEKWVVLLDDYNRKGEKRTAAKIEEKLHSCGVKFKKGVYRGEKDCLILCAESIGFLTSI